MKNPDTRIATERALAELVGQRIAATNDVCGMRCFHFGEWQFLEDGKRAAYGLQIQCAWRIEDDDGIIAGSGDYFSRASYNEDPSWEVGNPTGHLLEEKLRKLFGSHELEDGCCENRTALLRVVRVDADRVGGVQLQMTGGYTLVVFPRSSRDEDWALVRAAGQTQFVIKGGKVELRG